MSPIATVSLKLLAQYKEDSTSAFAEMLSAVENVMLGMDEEECVVRQVFPPFCIR